MELSELFEAIDQHTLYESDNNKAVFSFGRFNPPSAGHQKVIDKVVDLARKQRADYFIVPSRTQDRKKNPLSFEQKKYFIKKILGVDVYDDPTVKTPYHMAGWLENNGYDDVIMVVGADRVADFKKIEDHWRDNDKGSFKVVSAGERDPDAEGVTGISASKMRAFAVMTNGKKGLGLFMRGLPENTPLDIGGELFNAVRENLV